MTTRLYLTPIPDADADESEDRYVGNVEEAGKLNAGGTAVENVAADSNTLRVNGRFEFGRVLSRKLARELKSLSRGPYEALPLTVESAENIDDGYYEVGEADVSPVHPLTDTIYTYEVSLTPAGTREDTVRSIETAPEDVNTGLATGDPGRVGITASARRVKWYDESQGSERATPSDTVTAEFGDVDLYDLEDAPYDMPSLAYDVPLEDDGRVDVRVFDDRGRDKFATSGGEEVNVWTHAFDTGFEFTGAAVADNGLIRLRLDDDVTAEEYDPDSDSWDAVEIDSGDLTLTEWSIRSVSPTECDVRIVAEDSEDGNERSARLIVQRGYDGPILQSTKDDSLSPKYEEWFDGFASDVSSDPQPEQRIRDRDELA